MKTFAIPYESSIGVKPILIGVCAKCDEYGEWVAYDPYPGPGHRCDMEHDDCDPILHKRRAYKCPYKYCDYYYLTLKDFIEHEHGMLV